MNSKSQLLLILFSFFIFISCSDDDAPVNSPDDAFIPWESNVQAGNFAVNSKDIVINDDGASLSQSNYYVFQSELPQTELEFFTLVVYIPTDITDYVTELENVTAVVQHNGGQSTGNVYFSGEFIETTKLFGSDHSAYRLTARDTNFSSNQDTFMNIVYSFTVIYKDIVTAEIKNTRVNTQEVYVRN